MKIWNKTNINGLQLEYISADYSNAFITFDELQKALKLTKMLNVRHKIILTGSYTIMQQQNLD